MPKLKICGITDAAFAVEAARRGADYLGFVFAENSPRRIDAAKAREIAAAAKGPKFVGVFTGGDAAGIAGIASVVPLDVAQLHGAFTAETVAALKGRGLEVWRLYDGTFAGEDATLLDGRGGGMTGGTGKLADWSLVSGLRRAGRRVALAGGISADNVAAAVATGADIIDVNSSLEVSPGVKSAGRLEEFVVEFAKCVRG